MNNVSNEIVQEAITTENPDIVGKSITLDAEDEKDINRMNDIDLNLQVHIQFILLFYQSHH